MSPRRVYEAIVDELAATETTATFGLMGEDTAALITDLDRVGIAYYHARHENVATTMADGYAWASGGVGVAIISRGPGLTNGLTAAATAAKGGRRVLVITAATSPGRVSDLKVVDQRAIMEGVGLEYHEVGDPDDAVDRFRAAWASATAGRATVFAVPVALLNAVCSAPPDSEVRGAAPEHARPEGPSDADLQRAAATLGECSRPLILVGAGGASVEGRGDYERLADRTGALLGTTFLAKGLFDGHRLDAGVIGGFSAYSARPVLAEVDCVLAFGASLNGFTRGHGTIFPKARIVQFDIDPAAFGRHGPVDAAVVGDALGAARGLLDLVAPARDDAPQHADNVLEQLAERDIFGPADESGPDGIDPRTLVVLLDELLPQERLVVSDGGHHLGFGVTVLRVPRPGSMRLTADFAAVGMGLGTACGAAAARRDATTILFIGDGGLSMTLGDLATVVSYELPVVVVVMNDRAYGAERHFLDLEDIPHHHSLFDDVDFAGVAAAIGFESVTVRTAEDVRSAAGLLAGRKTPLLLDCKINPAVRAQWLTDLDAARRPAVAS